MHNSTTLTCTLCAVFTSPTFVTLVKVRHDFGLPILIVLFFLWELFSVGCALKGNTSPLLENFKNNLCFFCFRSFCISFFGYMIDRRGSSFKCLDTSNNYSECTGEVSVIDEYNSDGHMSSNTLAQSRM